MTIIVVSPGDAGNAIQRWSVPPDSELNKTPISRGIRIYTGTVAIAALGAGDETVVTLSLTFPTPYVYLPKSISIWFRSDDTTESFEANGYMQYNNPDAEQAQTFNLVSPGATHQTATNLALRAWGPQIGETWRNFINGERLDTFVLGVTDQTDTSAAGDIRWFIEFWEYDAEQCLNWEVNLQQQLIGP